MLWKLFWTFFKIGAFTFGSGYAMIALIEREVVDKRKWFEKEDFSNQFTLAQSAPGPFSLNTAVFVGYKMKGWMGAFVSVIGLVIPSFVIILLIAIYLADFRSHSAVNAAFHGIRPAVVALMAVPMVKYLIKMDVWRILIALGATFIIWRLGISPIYLLMAGAVLGIILCFYKKS